MLFWKPRRQSLLGQMGGYEMAINILRGQSDQSIGRVIDALKGYEADHAQARIDLYRQNSVSVRIRIIDPSFQSLNRPERHSRVWHYLEQLPEEIQSDISMLLLLTPDETKMSFANMEFEDPVPAFMP